METKFALLRRSIPPHTVHLYELCGHSYAAYGPAAPILSPPMGHAGPLVARENVVARSREIIFRRITMGLNKTGHMRWMSSVWIQPAWAMARARSRENRPSDTSKVSPPEAADRGNHTYSRVIMRLSIMIMIMILIDADQHQTMSSWLSH